MKSLLELLYDLSNNGGHTFHKFIGKYYGKCMEIATKNGEKPMPQLQFRASVVNELLTCKKSTKRNYTSQLPNLK